MPMKNPPHPGQSVRLNCLEPFGLSITEGAKALGVSRTTLSRLINGQSGVSPDMAIRLANARHWDTNAGGLRSGAGSPT
jgi:antitoxin HigA-1